MENEVARMPSLEKVRRLFGQEKEISTRANSSPEPSRLDQALAELAAMRERATGAQDHVRNAEARRRDVASYTNARAIEEEIAEARWEWDHAAAAIPSIEAKIARLREDLRDSQWRYSRFPEVLRLARGYAEAGRDAKRKFDALQAAIGSARSNGFEAEARIFFGFAPAISESCAVLADDLLDRFEAEIARLGEVGAPTRRREARPPVIAPPAPGLDRGGPIEGAAPAPVHRTAPAKTVDSRAAGSPQHAIRLGEPSAEAPSRPRRPDDLSPLGAGEVRVRVLRAGYPGADGQQCDGGQLVKLPKQIAETAMMRTGAVEIVEVFDADAVAEMITSTLPAMAAPSTVEGDAR
ncbi:MAG TPA: hypothetical protein VHW60_17720 [Caulobacteraceae bacterium]|jgi:hypothetical protein|nr:hypothetical protein [Caulobacteraceae bacterium]